MGWFTRCCCGGVSTPCTICSSGTQRPYIEADLPTISAGGMYTCPFSDLIADMSQTPIQEATCVWELKTYVTIRGLSVAITLWFKLIRDYDTADYVAAVFRAVLGHGVHSSYYEWMIEVSDPSDAYQFDCSDVFTLPFSVAVGTSSLGYYCGPTTGLGDVVLTPHT